MANSEKLISQRPAFQAALHAWYRVHQRKLPWRENPSLYKTVVSEFMLQQTQVVTVLPYFDRWLRELPDFATLAAASEAKVMKLWEGLGYYSRARNLHQLARIIVALPTPPRTPAGWRELPGIGPYTAAAITSITFDEPAAVVDGNVVRILARLTGEGRQFRDGTEAVKHFTPLADALVVGTQPGTHNQAMMELGATVCFRQKPMCPVCPVAEFCTARRTGAPGKIPRLKPKVIEPMFVIRTFCLDRGRLLLHRSHAKAKRLAGQHELPELSDLGISLPTQNLSLRGARKGDDLSAVALAKAEAIQPAFTKVTAWPVPQARPRRSSESKGGLDRHGALQPSPSLWLTGRAPRDDKTGLTLLLTKRRTITRHRITETIYRTKLTPALRQVIARSDTLVWVPLKQLDRHTLSGPHRRWIRELRVKLGI